MVRDLSCLEFHVAKHVVHFSEFGGDFRDDSCDSPSGFAYDSDDRRYLSHDVSELFDRLESENDSFKREFAAKCDVCHLSNLGTLVSVEGCVGAVLR